MESTYNRYNISHVNDTVAPEVPPMNGTVHDLYTHPSEGGKSVYEVNRKLLENSTKAAHNAAIKGIVKMIKLKSNHIRGRNEDICGVNVNFSSEGVGYMKESDSVQLAAYQKAKPNRIAIVIEEAPKEVEAPKTELFREVYTTPIVREQVVKIDIDDLPDPGDPEDEQEPQPPKEETKKDPAPKKKGALVGRKPLK